MCVRQKKKKKKKKKMEGVVLSLAGNALRLLMPMLQEKLSSLSWVHDNAQFISDELESMNAFLTKITSSRQANDPEFQVWASQVRDLAYDIEDWADEFNRYLSRPRWRHRSSPNLLTQLIYFPTRFRERINMANDVLHLKMRILAVSQRSQRYGLGRTSSSTQEGISHHDPRFAVHFIDDDQLIGIEKTRDTLIELLMLEEETGSIIISVVGMGGLGKTTLVKKVYDSPKMVERFQSCRAWINISQTFELKVVLRDIIEQLFFVQVDDDDQLNQEQLLQKINEMNEEKSVSNKLGEINGEHLVQRIRADLRHRRYVIVFDDLWDLEAWEQIRHAFPDNKLGSRIIVTTRNQDVAASCSKNDHYVYQVKPLSSQDSWHLFCKRVFPHVNNNICPPNLVELSEKILNKCAGLPLAIVTIAGVLASKRPVESEWHKLYSHLGSSMESNPNLDRMRRILSYSYEDLPCYIKPCFLYLSIFPKDYPIRRKRLLRRWTAEGLVRGKRDMSVENTAEWYFEELVNRSLILPSLIDGNGTVLICCVHDIMLEFIITVSMKENLVSIINESSKKQPQYCILRHLSIHQYAPMSNEKLAHVRSLTVFTDERESFLNTKMRLLRVLDLEGCQLSNQQLHIVGEFPLLKYLSLRNTATEIVPKSLGKLRNLETLDLKWTQVSRLPIQLSKLHRLHYIHVRMTPNGGAGMPSGMQRLKELRKLGRLSLKKGDQKVIRELGKMTQLTNLGVTDIGEENAVAFCASLDKLSDTLRHLTLCWSISNTFDLLKPISQPPLQLQTLRIEGRLDKLPPWISSLKYVSKIVLDFTDVNSNDMQVLQTLPRLIQLFLHKDSYQAKQLCIMQGGFPVLKSLHIEFVASLEEIHFKEGSAPLLETLLISDCFCGRQPVGMEHLPRLKKFQLC